MKTGNDTSARQRVLATLAMANPQELAAAVALLGAPHQVLDGAVDVRPVETGLVMVRGRTGGDGAPFNVGEATVTRAVVRIATGQRGHGYRLGRDKAAARNAALIDAHWQTAERRDLIETKVIAVVRARLDAERERASAEAAASRVEFFTLARESL